MKRVWALFGAAMAATLSIPASASAIGPGDIPVFCANGGAAFKNPGTPFVVPPAPDGLSWTLLIIEAKHSDLGLVFVDSPIVGAAYADPTAEEIQHVILCQSAAPEPSTTAVVDTTVPPPPTTVVDTTVPPPTTVVEPTTTIAEPTTTTPVEPTTTTPGPTTTAPRGGTTTTTTSPPSSTAGDTTTTARNTTTTVTQAALPPVVRGRGGSGESTTTSAQTGTTAAGGTTTTTGSSAQTSTSAEDQATTTSGGRTATDPTAPATREAILRSNLAKLPSSHSSKDGLVFTFVIALAGIGGLIFAGNRR